MQVAKGHVRQVAIANHHERRRIDIGTKVSADRLKSLRLLYGASQDWQAQGTLDAIGRQTARIVGRACRGVKQGGVRIEA